MTLPVAGYFTDPDQTNGGAKQGQDDMLEVLRSTETLAGSALQPANNLSDLANAATARTNLGLGGAALLDPGTDPGDVVQLDESGALPAVSGANLTDLPGGGSACVGLSSRLRMSTTGTSAAIAVTADEIVVEDGSDTFQTLRAVSLSLSLSTSGANGLDTGTGAGSTWYAVWVIAKADGTTAGLLSLSDSAPTLPSGYTFKARIGWIRTDGTANKYPLAFIQNGRRVRYKVAAGTNVTAYPTMISGLQGSFTTPTWVSFSTSSFVPPTAPIISVLVANGTTANLIAVAPNNSFGAYQANTNPPPLLAGGSVGNQCINGDIALESSALYTYSSATGVAQCLGWEDN